MARRRFYPSALPEVQIVERVETENDRRRLARIQAQREVGAARKVAPPLAERFSSQVVGMTWELGFNYRRWIEGIEDGSVVRLVRTRARWADEDGTEHEDPSCIEVWADNVPGPEGARRVIRAMKLGCLPAALAARLAPAIDAGERWGSSLKEIGRGTNPAVTVTIYKEF